MKNICQQVCDLFAWLCQTPHPSGQEQALMARIQQRLDDLDGKTWQDAAGNLICDLAASPGQQDVPLIALQGHVDMVCAVGTDDYKPQQDPISPVEHDGWLQTDGRSSLGADCGAGVAVMLWLAAYCPVPHPPLRLIFTVREEVGLGGARDLASEAVAGVHWLINTDGFRWGRVVTGSAGGVREHYQRALQWADAPKLPNGRAYRLTWNGLRGGHSGFDMGAHRGNAVLWMGELLRELRMESPFALAGFVGGTAFNAIPYSCCADVLTIAPADDAIQQIGQRIIQRWHRYEPDARLDIQQIELPKRVWSGDVASGLLTVLGGFVDGVYAKHPIIDAVSDSSNLGHVFVHDEQVCIDAMLRCMDTQAEQALQTSHRTVCAMCGFVGQVVSRYPAWPEQNAGTLRQVVAQSYQAVTGQAPEFTVQHVGLEPSLLLEKNPAMECICMGMELQDCHSPQERWKLDTIEPFVQTICQILTRLCSNKKSAT